MQKWNYKKHEYELYEVPSDWNCSIYENDMNKIVNCAHCGKEIEYGETYCSIEIHTAIGFGYAVCGECYNEEKERRKRGVSNVG